MGGAAEINSHIFSKETSAPPQLLSSEEVHLNSSNSDAMGDLISTHLDEGKREVITGNCTSHERACEILLLY